MRSATLVGWVLALLIASIASAQERRTAPADSYYLTVTLMRSHVPGLDDSKKLLPQLSRRHTTATLQIELDIDGKTPYKSTTVAQALERDSGTWLSRALGRTDNSVDIYTLTNYDIVTDRRMYKGDQVTIRAIYSATIQSISAMQNFLKTPHEGLKTPFTYSGLASQALRMFTRSEDVMISRRVGLAADEIQHTDCITLAPNHDGPTPCEFAALNFPHAQLKLNVSRTHFTGKNILSVLNNYIDIHHSDWLDRFTKESVSIDQLSELCREFEEVLDDTLVPRDRNLVLLAAFNRRNYNPYEEGGIRCWRKHKGGLEPLILEYDELKVTGCTSVYPYRLDQCRSSLGLMRGWRGVDIYEGGKFRWEVTSPDREKRRGEDGLKQLSKSYELMRRYGDFEYDQDAWHGVGSVLDKTKSDDHHCLFTARIELAFLGETQELYRLKVTADKDADMETGSIREPWGESPRECRGGE